MEDTPAPPYEPSPTHSYHDPDIYSRSPSPSQQDQQTTADQDPLMEIAKTLMKIKNLHLAKKMTTAANNTGEQSTTVYQTVQNTSGTMGTM